MELEGDERQRGRRRERERGISLVLVVQSRGIQPANMLLRGHDV